MWKHLSKLLSNSSHRQQRALSHRQERGPWARQDLPMAAPGSSEEAPPTKREEHVAKLKAEIEENTKMRDSLWVKIGKVFSKMDEVEDEEEKAKLNEDLEDLEQKLHELEKDGAQMNNQMILLVPAKEEAAGDGGGESTAGGGGGD